MKLKVGDALIQMPVDQTISIERNSPILNDDTGTFSYPFPVPFNPNAKALGWPGRLQRKNKLGVQDFLLEDSGIQVLRGETAYDSINRDEIGLVLKSGNTIFYKKMEGVMLGDIDFGGEYYPYVPLPKVGGSYDFSYWDAWKATYGTDPDPRTMLENRWREYNALGGDIILAPFYANVDNKQTLVNYVNSSGQLYITHNIDISALSAPYCFQFKVNFILTKIFEDAGYSVNSNQFAVSIHKNAIIFGKIMIVGRSFLLDGGVTYSYISFPKFNTLYYADLMPEIEVLDFIETIKNMFCFITVPLKTKKVL
ncbi:hypothetical protein [Gaoshiqia sp. Z1-71]|uniref:hypothetical protein n=1 Tax=Gaoshiqia hydrogeniformans TaxID=3290090 RepID=UPI003BF8109C